VFHLAVLVFTQTGMWFDARTGYYYEPLSHTFYDSLTSSYYTYDEEKRTYVPVVQSAHLTKDEISKKEV
jgi:hypothetical protein